MTAHGYPVNYSQALPEVTVQDTVIVNLPFHLAEGSPRVGLHGCRREQGELDHTHSWCDRAHVHTAHMCTCQLGHASKYGHGEEKSIFTL